jgi:hypothetical protein
MNIFLYVLFWTSYLAVSTVFGYDPTGFEVLVLIALSFLILKK